jgi:hypothetical protein
MADIRAFRQSPHSASRRSRLLIEGCTKMIMADTFAGPEWNRDGTVLIGAPNLDIFDSRGR